MHSFIVQFETKLVKLLRLFRLSDFTLNQNVGYQYLCESESNFSQNVVLTMIHIITWGGRQAWHTATLSVAHRHFRKQASKKNIILCLVACICQLRAVLTKLLAINARGGGHKIFQNGVGCLLEAKFSIQNLKRKF